MHINALAVKTKLTTMTMLLAGMLLLAACTGITPSPDAPVQAEQDSTASSEATEAESATVDGTIEELSFASQGDTFLSHIQNAIREMGTPEARFYIELPDQAGAVWQGERLVYPQGDVVFLQQAESDGSAAIRLDVPTGTDEESIQALLPQTEGATGDKPNVDIQFVRARRSDTGEWSFDVTVEHPDTGWEDYADGWQVETPEGEILGVRILVHPHVGEQPFTRSLGGVIVPEDVTEVRIRPHDLVSGYGPVSVAIPLEEAGSGELYEVIR